MKTNGLFKILSGILASALLLTGCGVGNAPAAPQAERKPLALLLAEEDAFLLDLKRSIEAEAAAAAYELLSYNAGGDAETQLLQAQKALAEGAGALIVTLADDKAGGKIAEIAAGAGVVLLNRAPADRRILHDHMVFVGCEETRSGILQGEALASCFAGREAPEIRYLLFQGTPGLESTEKRADGAIQGLFDAGLTAVAAAEFQTCDFSRDRAYHAMRRLLAEGIEYDCIIANNDAMALGAIDAIEEAGLDASQTPIVGIDASADGIDALSQGKLLMTVDPNAPEQASAAAAAAVNLEQGRAFDEGIHTPKATVGGNVQPYMFVAEPRAVTERP